MAWSSQAGFHQGSSMKTWLATCKFSPSPPAFSEIRMIFIEGSVLKAVRASSRACMVIPPRKTRHEMPALFRRNSTSSSIAPNCEKIKPLALGSLSIIFWTSSQSASIFVLLLKSDGLTFCMMFLLPSFGTAASECPAAAGNARAVGSGGCGSARRLAAPAGCFGGVSQMACLALLASERVSLEPRFGVAAAADVRGLPPFAAPPAPSSPSSSLPPASSPRSTQSRVKHTGQPTPPEGNCGASMR
mmetsp:Transcript_5523/g.15323  ORF Transcript_5523/g.15323 Transcript_5523/m.15323 type:complete len:245 (+) Transcript_5523:327-1061(+)